MRKLVLCLTLFVATSLFAQNATIRGRVTIASDGSALPGATVAIDELNLRTVTDAQGQYQLIVPASNVRGQSVKLSVTMEGFQPRTINLTLNAGETTHDFALRVGFGQEITVGSRAINAESEKAVPVDIIPRQQIETTPSTETNQIIEKIAPSFNFPRPTITDGTDSVRPATLRGLGPDQVLVMVNGKRRHPSALININSSIGRGSSGVDLNAIPASAIDSIEILRDGAAAQYGSDAIAGVLNLVLKSDAAPLKLEAKGGATTHGDGQTIDTNLSGGWNVGRGALFGTFEYRDRYETNRALRDPRDQIKAGDAKNNPVLQPNTHWGDSYERDIMSLLNLNLPFTEDGKQILYAFGTWGLRHGSHGGNYRRAIDATDWPQIYPLGFLPLIEPRIVDQALNGGVRGEMAKWFYDVSAGYGRNKYNYFVRHSLNVSLGPDIPPNQTSFYAGSMADRQYTLNFDVSRGFNVGLAGPLNIAAGAEYRRDGYQIGAGEPNSYIDGGHANQFGGKAVPGSQVFPGFRPANEVDVSRNSRAFYVDTEGDVLSQLRVGLAGRYEHFSDFGSTTNGKVTLRYAPVKPLIFRAAASTGFRAPSLTQSWFSTVSTNFLRDPVSGVVVPFEVGTYPVASPVAVALGATPLRPETSRNYSGGAVWQPMSNLEMTADFFHIDIKHRIVLTGNFNQPQVQPLLAPFGTSSARFFSNAIDTRTNGYDLVINHQRPLLGGRIDLSGAYSNNKTKIVSFAPTPPQLTGLGAVLYDHREQRTTECGQPRDNARLMQSYSQGAWNITARQSRYGEFCSLSTLPKDDQTHKATWLTDLELSYGWSRYTFAIGAENLFDAFPTMNRGAGTPSASEQVGSAGVFAYPRNSPFGMNGRFVYSRVAVRF
ncbi:MAG TPA: TonB-dependent receptor [Thermoanaerobaculia bacterium]|jgi:iron complex outermembrane receptor protein|nr:TonB-dependent receptor [Thermoanaerobaculia bacterium]